MPHVQQDPHTMEVRVSYVTKEVQQRVTKAEYEAICFMTANGGVIHAIKFVRSQYNLGLFEAKQVVDTIRNTPITPYY